MQVNKVLHRYAYAAMFGNSQHTCKRHLADLSMDNRQTITFVSPSLSRVLSAKTSSLHGDVFGVQAMVCTTSLCDAGTVSANLLCAPSSQGYGLNVCECVLQCPAFGL